MKLAVLGGTSKVDQHLLKRALRSGYFIRFLGSHTNPLTSSNLTVLTGSLNDITAIEETLKGTHAVIALPHAITDFETLGNVIQTMHAFGITRLVLAADLYNNQPQHLKAMLQKAGIDWTVIHHGQDSPAGVQNYFAIPDADFASYLIRQVTDATNVRTAMVLSN